MTKRKKRRRRRHSKRWYIGMRNRIIFGCIVALLLWGIIVGIVKLVQVIETAVHPKAVVEQQVDPNAIVVPDFMKKYDNQEISSYFVYGPHMNIKGSFTSEQSVRNVFLYLLTNDSESPASYTSRKILQYDSEAQSFSSGTIINQGLSLETLEPGYYYLMLAVTYSDNSVDYYNLKDASGEEELSYYTLTDVKTGTNRVVTITNESGFMAIHVKEATLPENVYDVVVDAGHGGSDVGATRGSEYERDLVLQVAQETKYLLEQAGYKVLLTRDGSEPNDAMMAYTMYDPDGRVNMACGSMAKYAISIHMNSNENVSAGGVQMYCSVRGDTTFAKYLADQVVGATGTSYSSMETGYVEKGVYHNPYTLDTLAEATDHAQRKGYEPYNIDTNTDYLFMIRELGGIATNAYVDGRNPEYGTNEYLSSNYGVESCLTEIGFMSVDADLGNVKANHANYATGLANGIMKQIEEAQNEDSIVTAK